jgi:hypothetical protein
MLEVGSGVLYHLRLVEEDPGSHILASTAGMLLRRRHHRTWFAVEDQIEMERLADALPTERPPRAGLFRPTRRSTFSRSASTPTSG